MDTTVLVEGLSAALTPLIAVVTTYIAYQQWLTNKSRLAHELYDRRLAVFKAVRTLYGEIGDAGTAKYCMVRRFYATTAEAEFLFGDEIPRHLEELYERGMDLSSLHEKDVSVLRRGGAAGRSRTFSGSRAAQCVASVVRYRGSR